MIRIRSQVPRLTAALTLTALSAAFLPAAAQAAPSGSATIELTGRAAKALTSQARLGAQKPATASSRRIVLKVTGGTVGSSASLTLGGSVSFSARAGRRTRTVKATAWQTSLSGTRSKLSAKIGKRRVVLFAIATPKRSVALDKAAGTAKLTGGRATLTAAGASALRRGLALRQLASGPLGAAKLTAKLDVKSTGTPTPGSGGGTTTPGSGGGTTNPGTGGGTTPPGTGGGTTPRPPSCEGFSVGNVPTASALLARSAYPTAANVSAADFSWYPRDSWTRYISSGVAAGDGVTPTDGATAGPVEAYPTARSPRLVYSYRFAFVAATSWYDPLTTTGVLTFTGSVRFLWAAHGIDITLRNPEIELNGARSRAVFTVAGASCSSLPAKRVELLSLAQTSPAATPPSYAFPRIDATITAAGATAFSDMYFPGDEWGSLQSLTVTTAP